MGHDPPRSQPAQPGAAAGAWELVTPKMLIFRFTSRLSHWAQGGVAAFMVLTKTWKSCPQASQWYS